MKEYKNPIGIDVGVKNIMTTSNGEVYPSMKDKFGRLTAFKRSTQGENLKEKDNSTVNEKTKESVLARFNEKQELYYRAAVKLAVMGADCIVLETLDFQHLIDIGENHFKKAIVKESRLDWLIELIKEEAEANKADVLFIDRYWPSSQHCNDCGHRTGPVTYKIDAWDCSHCGIHHDNRDINASKNIRDKGLGRVFPGDK